MIRRLPFILPLTIVMWILTGCSTGRSWSFHEQDISETIHASLRSGITEVHVFQSEVLMASQGEFSLVNHTLGSNRGKLLWKEEIGSFPYVLDLQKLGLEEVSGTLRIQRGVISNWVTNLSGHYGAAKSSSSTHSTSPSNPTVLRMRNSEGDMELQIFITNLPD